MSRGSRCELANVRVEYRPKGRSPTTALDVVDLAIEPGEFVCIRGPSGSGKTTLLMLLGGMQRPTSGRVAIDGDDLYAGPPERRARYRASTVGFVFQMFHLVPYLDVVDNVRLAGGHRSAGDRRAARELLERTGLAARADHRPEELSAGERQRAAIARALFHEPSLLLADEPTGNLDPDNAHVVLEMLSDFHRSGGTVVLVTHGPLGDERADRILQLTDGRLAVPGGAR